MTSRNSGFIESLNDMEAVAPESEITVDLVDVIYSLAMFT